MDILVVGNDHLHAEFTAKFGAKHSITFKSCDELSTKDLGRCEIVFDFDIAEVKAHALLYRQNPKVILFLNSVKTTLIELVKEFTWKNTVIGFNGLPGMVDRQLLELTSYQASAESIKEICDRLGTDFKLVHDRVGMITPRILCMIINEACTTVQEGTANREDIDLAMKLGMNYPAGPFEMLATLGIKNVYDLLLAMHRDTGEERYKICPLLKRYYLES